MDGWHASSPSLMSHTEVTTNTSSRAEGSIHPAKRARISSPTLINSGSDLPPTPRVNQHIAGIALQSLEASHNLINALLNAYPAGSELLLASVKASRAEEEAALAQSEAADPIDFSDLCGFRGGTADEILAEGVASVREIVDGCRESYRYETHLSAFETMLSSAEEIITQPEGILAEVAGLGKCFAEGMIWVWWMVRPEDVEKFKGEKGLMERLKEVRMWYRDGYEDVDPDTFANLYAEMTDLAEED